MNIDVAAESKNPDFFRHYKKNKNGLVSAAALTAIADEWLLDRYLHVRNKTLSGTLTPLEVEYYNAEQVLLGAELVSRVTAGNDVPATVIGQDQHQLTNNLFTLDDDELQKKRRRYELLFNIGVYLTPVVHNNIVHAYQVIHAEQVRRRNIAFLQGIQQAILQPLKERPYTLTYFVLDQFLQIGQQVAATAADPTEHMVGNKIVQTVLEEYHFRNAMWNPNVVFYRRPPQQCLRIKSKFFLDGTEQDVQFRLFLDIRKPEGTFRECQTCVAMFCDTFCPSIDANHRFPYWQTRRPNDPHYTTRNLMADALYHYAEFADDDPHDQFPIPDLFRVMKVRPKLALEGFHEKAPALILFRMIFGYNFDLYHLGQGTGPKTLIDYFRNKHPNLRDPQQSTFFHEEYQLALFFFHYFQSLYSTWDSIDSFLEQDIHSFESTFDKKLRKHGAYDPRYFTDQSRITQGRVAGVYLNHALCLCKYVDGLRKKLHDLLPPPPSAQPTFRSKPAHYYSPLAPGPYRDHVQYAVRFTNKWYE